MKNNYLLVVSFFYLLLWNLGHFLPVLDKKILREAAICYSYEIGLIFTIVPTNRAYQNQRNLAIDSFLRFFFFFFFLFVRPTNRTGSHFLRDATTIDSEQPLPSYA